MATYKKGFKKQSSEQMLLKVIVGIISAVMLIVAVAFIYDLAVSSHNYDEFSNITKFSDVLELENTDGNALSNYVVYIYQNSCTACEEARKDVLKLAHNINKSEEVFFLAKYDDITDKSSASEAQLIDLIGGTQIVTPTLVVFVDGEFEEAVTGVTDVISLLQTIKAGTYEPFN